MNVAEGGRVFLALPSVIQQACTKLPPGARHSAATGQTYVERYSSDLCGLFSRLGEA